MSAARGFSDSSGNSRRISRRAIRDQLSDVILQAGGDLEENLRSILSQEQGTGNVVTGEDIHYGLFAAAIRDNVEACRLLWGHLSRRGQRLCFQAVIATCGPLHIAAARGHLKTARLFLEEFKWSINQKNHRGDTPLSYALQESHLEMARFLLENGADPNKGSGNGPLYNAVDGNNAEVVRLLLQHSADPNLLQTSLSARPTRWKLRITDNAIRNGYADILRMLLEYGACIGSLFRIDARIGTSLNVLLCLRRESRATKLAICRILLENAKEDPDAAALMRVTFEFVIKRAENEHCRILLDAGFDPRISMFCAIRAENLAICQSLVQDYRVDPFLRQETDEKLAAASPFLATARLADTSLFEYMLGVWDERFASSFNGGKNGNVDYPLHLACCDPLVSLQAIKLLVDRHADVLAMVGDERGFLPLHIAAKWGASLNVIFYVLQHCPNALLRDGVGYAAGAAPPPHASTFLLDEGHETKSSATTDIGTMMVETFLGNNDNGPRMKKAKTERSDDQSRH